MNELIAIDWGTSSLRAARMDASGRVLEERNSQQGILTVPPGGFPDAFDDLCAAWVSDGTLALMSGMVGSRQGWQEAPYCACPAGFEDVAAALAWVSPRQVAIVPGLSCDTDGIPDVMRGEEVQVLGALRLLGLRDATVVLPGTHSKWVVVRAGRIERFATWMTGEFYALLRQQSILARMLPADDDAFDADAFDAGVAQAATPGGVLHHLFSVRTLALFGRASGVALASRLSGLLIGEELRAQAPLLAATTPITVVGSPALALRYQRALQALGHGARLAPADAGWLGMLAVARAAGLLPPAGTLAA